MEIYLIRHTTPAIEKGICYGQSDIPYAGTFETERAKLLRHLPAAVGALYTSPLLRCKKLAESIESQTSLVTDSRLQEMHFGDWELRSWESIPPEELNPWMNDFVTVRPPGGENFETLHARTGAFLEELQSKSHATVAVVTHAGVIRSLLARILEMPLKNAFKLPVNYASVTKLRLDTKSCYCSLEYLNKEG